MRTWYALEVLIHMHLPQTFSTVLSRIENWMGALRSLSRTA